MSPALLGLFNNLVGFYMFIVFAMVISSWLLSFNIINMRNPMVAQIIKALHSLTEPVLGPIRRVLPSFGGLDFSPIILLFGLMFFRDIVNNFAMGRFG